MSGRPYCFLEPPLPKLSVADLRKLPTTLDGVKLTMLRGMEARVGDRMEWFPPDKDVTEIARTWRNLPTLIARDFVGADPPVNYTRLVMSGVPPARTPVMPPPASVSGRPVALPTDKRGSWEEDSDDVVEGDTGDTEADADDVLRQSQAEEEAEGTPSTSSPPPPRRQAPSPEVTASLASQMAAVEMRERLASLSLTDNMGTIKVTLQDAGIHFPAAGTKKDLLDLRTKFLETGGK